MEPALLFSALHDFEHVLTSSVAMKLLRINNTAVYCAILRARFMTGEPVVEGPRLTELVAEDLRALRGEGYESDVTAAERIASWVRDGYLVRSIIDGRPVEQYQLSTGAVEAITLLTDLVEEHTAATESTMSLMVEQLLRIEADSDPDPSSRIENLRAQQADLQRRIDAIAGGYDEPLDTTRIVERLNAARSLGAKVPVDVARHKDNIRRLDRDIRAAARDSDGTYAEVLAALFDGEDALADTEEARTFGMFLSYLMDPRLRDRLSIALDAIRARDIPGANALLTEMDEFFAAVAAQAQEVKAVQGNLNRALRRFIQSREYLAQRQLREALTDAHANAPAAFAACKPSDGTGLTLDLRALDIRSVASLRLKTRFTSVPEPVADGQHGRDAFAAEAASLYPIDRALLRNLINDTIDARGGAATCGEIVARSPRSLHLGEVLHVCQTAVATGMADPDGHEDIPFASTDGTRTVRVPYFLITNRVSDEEGQYT